MDAHGLTIREKASKFILGTNNIMEKNVGMSSMSLLLAPNLEVDVSPYTWATSTIGCWDMMCCVGTMRPLA